VTGVPARDALDSALVALQAARLDTPRLDAEVLLAEVLETDRAGLVTGAARGLAAGEAERFDAFVARREGREPVAYILGRKPFRFLELYVDSRVLIPRPDTEVLVETGLDLPRGSRVVDVGTGSGAVALSLKHERPDLHVTATDIEAGALAVARANARRLGLEVSFRQADLLKDAGGPFDAVLANVPYVAPEIHAELAPEIRQREPRVAVVADEDGLAIVRRLVSQLGDTPFAALEVGLAQEDQVAELLRQAGYAQIETRRDLAGIERVVVARHA
jgi:release factor glutamine methyltransferase